MKELINSILVVEGIHDAGHISSIYNCEIVTTNGYEIPEDTIRYLKAASTYKQIVVLVDPDNAGKEIRNRLNNEIKNLINVEVDISCCYKKNKHGVAECSLEEIKRKLRPFVDKNPQNQIYLSNFELIEVLNKNPQNKEIIIDSFPVGICNTKTLLRRLNTLRIDKDKLLKGIEDANR